MADIGDCVAFPFEGAGDFPSGPELAGFRKGQRSLYDVGTRRAAHRRPRNSR
jgi:hypothetical protein